MRSTPRAFGVFLDSISSVSLSHKRRTVGARLARARSPAREPWQQQTRATLGARPRENANTQTRFVRARSRARVCRTLIRRPAFVAFSTCTLWYRLGRGTAPRSATSTSTCDLSRGRATTPRSSPDPTSQTSRCGPISDGAASRCGEPSAVLSNSLSLSLSRSRSRSRSLEREKREVSRPFFKIGWCRDASKRRWPAGASKYSSRSRPATCPLARPSPHDVVYCERASSGASLLYESHPAIHTPGARHVRQARIRCLAPRQPRRESHAAKAAAHSPASVSRDRWGGSLVIRERTRVLVSSLRLSFRRERERERCCSLPIQRSPGEIISSTNPQVVKRRTWHVGRRVGGAILAGCEGRSPR